MKVAEHVRGYSNYSHYRAGNLWYVTEDTKLEFPVPVEDTEGATLGKQEKSMMLMRWIRKHVASLNEAVAAKQAA